MPEPIIKTENLNIVFDQNTPKENHVLKNINIEIFPGEYVIFFGPSGCGKSTLLYHLAGLDHNIKDGKIIIDGDDITKLTEQEVLEIRKKKLGMVFQAYNLITTIKIIHNVAMPYYFQEKNNKETIKKAEVQLERLGVLSQKDKLPPALSGGQQQRVAIARALITDPDIIFADEAVGNLDFNSAYDVLNIISDLNIKHKKTIVFVTHDMNYLQFADKIIYLWDGGVSKVEINRRKVTPAEKFGNIKKNKISQFTQRLATSLVNFILIGKEKDVLGDRVKEKLVDFLTHNMSWEGLISFFSSPIRLGGLGFPFTRVKSIEQVLKKMRIQNNLLFFKYFNKIDKNDIVEVICQEVECELDAFQKQRLANMIELTMSGIVDEKNMFKFLTASIKDKGLNITEPKAVALNEKIQIFLDLLATVKTSKESMEGEALDATAEKKPEVSLKESGDKLKNIT
jgi:putative ABC transport system ATP-binding protein